MGVFSHLPTGPSGVDATYQSCRFNTYDSPGLAITQGTPTNEKIWTLSLWIKRCTIGSSRYLFEGYGDASNRDIVQFVNSTDQLRFFLYRAASATSDLKTNRVFRDTSSWYHIVIAYDSPNATAALRMRIFVNGVQETSFATETYPAQNTQSYINRDTYIQALARFSLSAANYLGGYLSEVYFIDGQSLDSSYFGELSQGVWIPKVYSGTYGNSGYYLDFSNSSHFGEDQSGNNNDLTDAGLDTTDQVDDAPTNNWCTINPLSAPASSVFNGSLNFRHAASEWVKAQCSHILTSGKWYFEYKIGASEKHTMIGVERPNVGYDPVTAVTYCGIDAYGWSAFHNIDVNYYRTYHSGSYVSYAGISASASDVMQCAVDVDSGKIWFGRNNTWFSGDPAAGTGELYSGLPSELVPTISIYASTETDSYVNFGQLGFAYTPPSGFIAINSDNLSVPSIINGNVAFDIELYEGTGSEKTITGLEFSPDLVWIKARDSVVEHVVNDSVRGVELELNPDSNNVESSEAQGLTAFTADGFTIGTNANYNDSGENFVAWCLLEGAAYGVDIVSYSGTGSNRTVSHNLGVVPELMIVKNRERATGWLVYHEEMIFEPEKNYLYLDTSAKVAAASTVWNNTAPTSSVFTVGTFSGVNQSGEDIVAYLFASIEGFSKVFVYDGNANADGRFVYCGFRPKYILLKTTESVAGWIVLDSSRDVYNVADDYIYANLDNAEATTTLLDILSNGFKLRTTNSAANPAETMVGIAFAEAPSKYANAR